MILACSKQNIANILKGVEMGNNAIIVPRGCGDKRTGGDCYCECGLSPFGLPIEHFLRDTPALVSKEELGLSAQGTKLIARRQKCQVCNGEGLIGMAQCLRCNGQKTVLVYHVYDIVSHHQYDVADYVEETRRFGMSRKIAKNTDFSKITPESMHVLLHEKAYIENAYKYYGIATWQDIPRYGWATPCPKEIEEHVENIIDTDFETVCLGTCWQDVEDGVPIEPNSRIVTKTLPSFEYTAACRPLKVSPEYRLAIFAALPITRLVVVKGPKDAETLEKVKQSGKQVDLVNE